MLFSGCYQIDTLGSVSERSCCTQAHACGSGVAHQVPLSRGTLQARILEWVERLTDKEAMEHPYFYPMVKKRSQPCADNAVLSSGLTAAR